MLLAYCHEKRVQSYNNLTKPPSFLKTFYPFPVYFTLLRHYNSSHKPHMKKILTPNCSTSHLSQQLCRDNREKPRTKRGVSPYQTGSLWQGSENYTGAEKHWHARGKTLTRAGKNKYTGVKEPFINYKRLRCLSTLIRCKITKKKAQYKIKRQLFLSVPTVAVWPSFPGNG